MTPVRRFTFEDWQQFSGAAQFPDGSDPFVANGELAGARPFVVTGDPDGIFVAYEQAEGSEYQWVMPTEQLEPMTAQILVRLCQGILQGSDGQAYWLGAAGFQCISQGASPRLVTLEYLEALGLLGE